MSRAMWGIDVCRLVGVPCGMRLWALIGLVLLASCGGGGQGEVEIHDIQPRAGSASGSQAVRITGRHFRQDIGYTIYFGGSRADEVTILDETTLLVGTPSHDSGAVDVYVVADNGPAFKIHSGYRFTGGDGAEAEPGEGQPRERF